MNGEKFHFSAVLSVIHNQNLSNETVSLLSYIFDKRVHNEQVIDLMPSCRDYLLECFPELDTPSIKSAFQDLNEALEADNNSLSCPTKIISDWLVEILPLCTCEEHIKVERPKKTHQKRGLRSE
jgi:hypothetical protein